MQLLKQAMMASPVLGVDARQPRFGWSLASAQRSVVQTAYQIQLSTNGTAANQTLVWDSGKVSGSSDSTSDRDSDEEF